MDKLIMVGVPVGLMVVPLILWALEKLSARALNMHTTSGVVLQKVISLAHLVVADLNATMKDQILEASKDGTITENEGKVLKTVAITRMKVLLGDSLLAIAPSSDTQKTLLGAAVEAAVSASKPMGSKSP